MATEKKIKLTELLAACVEFTKNPTDANELKILEMTKLFMFREYIPLVEKQVIIATIIAALPGEDGDALVAQNNLAMGKIINGVLAYVINLENDLDRVAMTPSVIDILFKTGVIDNILEHCEKDYRRLEKMIDDTINFTNIFRLIQTASLMSGEQFEIFISELKRLNQELTPEVLDKLMSLSAAGSPEFGVLREAAKEEALANVNSDEAKIKPKKPEGHDA